MSIKVFLSLINLLPWTLSSRDSLWWPHSQLKEVFYSSSPTEWNRFLQWNMEGIQMQDNKIFQSVSCSEKTSTRLPHPLVLWLSPEGAEEGQWDRDIAHEKYRGSQHLWQNLRKTPQRAMTNQLWYLDNSGDVTFQLQSKERTIKSYNSFSE